MSDTIKARNCMAVDPFEDAEDDVKAWAKERQREYEIGAMLDRELGLDEPEVGNDLMVRAAAVLRSRGISLDAASHDELLDALVRVSP
jgi:hypothetical protein